jgi:hypothetical protein
MSFADLKFYLFSLVDHSVPKLSWKFQQDSGIVLLAEGPARRN